MVITSEAKISHILNEYKKGSIAIEKKLLYLRILHETTIYFNGF